MVHVVMTPVSLTPRQITPRVPVVVSFVPVAPEEPAPRVASVTPMFLTCLLKFDLVLFLPFVIVFMPLIPVAVHHPTWVSFEAAPNTEPGPTSPNVIAIPKQHFMVEGFATISVALGV